MSLSSVGVTIAAKEYSKIQWADSSDHTKDFGKQAMGFYQWNVNLFYQFPSLRLSYSDEYESDESYNVTDTGTLTLQILDATGVAMTNSSIDFLYTERRSGDPDVGWNYEYKTQVTQMAFGAEQFEVFNAVKYIITCGTRDKRNKNTRLNPVRSANVMWFRAVPSKNMVNISYSTNFTTREVFHFGASKGNNAEDQASAEKKAQGSTTPTA